MEQRASRRGETEWKGWAERLLDLVPCDPLVSACRYLGVLPAEGSQKPKEKTGQHSFLCHSAVAGCWELCGRSVFSRTGTTVCRDHPGACVPWLPFDPFTSYRLKVTHTHWARGRGKLEAYIPSYQDSATKIALSSSHRSTEKVRDVPLRVKGCSQEGLSTLFLECFGVSDVLLRSSEYTQKFTPGLNIKQQRLLKYKGM